MIRNLFGGTKCRTIDKVDIFGDSSGVALYQLDGNANDTGGNYHGTETAIMYGGGVYERGGVFNGTTSKVDATTLPSMGTSNACSFLINTASTANQGFIEYSNGTNLIAIYHTSTTLAVRVNALLYTVTTTLPKSAFNYLVVSFTTNVPTMYLNGAAQTLGSVGATAIAGTSGLRIGVANVATVQTYTVGSIDQVRIFNRAITATEVATLYAECAPTSTVDNINPFEDGSLKALYQFNGDATDATGAYNGTATNVTYGTGKFGQCVVSNGTTSRVMTEPVFSNAMTISCWGYITTLGVSQMLFGEIDGSGTSASVRIGLGLTVGNNFLVSLGNGTLGLNNSTVASGLVVNTWNMFTLVINNLTVFLYKNGTLVGSYVSTTPIGTHTVGNFGFLNYGNYTNGTFNLRGSLEQTRIFNKALTPMEVASLYNETTPLEEPMYKLVDPFRDGSGKALYRLEGNALDESGNYNGTATSVTYEAALVGRQAVFGGASSISVAMALSANTFSYSVWATVTTVSSTIQSLIDFSTGRAMLSSGNGTNAYLSYYDGTAYRVFGTYALTSATKTHIGLAVNGTSIELFINGVSQGTSACSAVTPSGNLYLGRYAGSAAGYLTGREDQPRIFTRVLTASEFQQLYTQGA